MNKLIFFAVFAVFALSINAFAANTLDFKCLDHLRGKSESECVAIATQQLSALGCEVDNSPTKMEQTPKVTCGFGGERTQCGIFHLKNCSYVGGQPTDKDFYSGGNERCVAAYGKSAVFKKNTDKNPAFAGICVIELATTRSSSSGKAKTTN